MLARIAKIFLRDSLTAFAFAQNVSSNTQLRRCFVVWCRVWCEKSRFRGAVDVSGNQAAQTGGGVATGNGGTTT